MPATANSGAPSASRLQASFREQVRPPNFESIWLEYGKELPIALFALAAILAYLILHYVQRAPRFEDVPLYLALVVGGVPLLVSLAREAFGLHFGSDWLAGISIITAVLLHQYLVGSIVVLMLSGGSALDQYAIHRASSAWRALACRMPTIGHRVTSSGVEAVQIDAIVPGDIIEIFPHEICPIDGEGRGLRQDG